MKLRNGQLPSLHDPYFQTYRKQPDNVVQNIANMVSIAIKRSDRMSRFLCTVWQIHYFSLLCRYSPLPEQLLLWVPSFLHWFSFLRTSTPGNSRWAMLLLRSVLWVILCVSVYPTLSRPGGHFTYWFARLLVWTMVNKLIASLWYISSSRALRLSSRWLGRDSFDQGTLALSTERRQEAPISLICSLNVGILVQVPWWLLVDWWCFWLVEPCGWVASM